MPTNDCSKNAGPAGLPPKQGLYDPQFEHDACGVGFVVNIKGRKSHQIVQQGLTILRNLAHRGASGAEPNTGDGAGILLQMPDAFLRQVCAEFDITLPAPGHYGVGMVFTPIDEADRRACEARFDQIVAEEGQQVLGWRTIPTDNSSLGATALRGEPAMRQVFIQRSDSITDDMAFERKLYVIRKRAEKEIRYGGFPGGGSFYISSLSYKTLIYKGMLTSEQVEEYYPCLLYTSLTHFKTVIKPPITSFPILKRLGQPSFLSEDVEHLLGPAYLAISEAAIAVAFKDDPETHQAETETTSP